jgi:hypothetical protein
MALPRFLRALGATAQQVLSRRGRRCRRSRSQRQSPELMNSHVFDELGPCTDGGNGPYGA